jgi:hypothetical protein
MTFLTLNLPPSQPLNSRCEAENRSRQDVAVYVQLKIGLDPEVACRSMGCTLLCQISGQTVEQQMP